MDEQQSRIEFTRAISAAQTMTEREAALRPYLHAHGWDDAIIAALRDFGVEGGELLYRLTLDPARQPSSYEDLFHRDLIFALKAANAGVPLSDLAQEALVAALLPALFQTAIARQKPQAAVADKISRELHELVLPDLRERLTNAFIPHLQDSDHDVRRIAAYGLGWVRADSPLAIAALIAMLHCDEDKYNRRWVAEVLADVGVNNLTVSQALREQMRDETDNIVRESLAPILSEQGEEDQVIADLLHLIPLAEDGFKRKCAVFALHNALRAGQRPHPEVVAPLLGLLHYPNGGVRYAAAGTLGSAGDASDRVIEALLHTLSHDQDNVVHCSAMDSLLELRPADRAITERVLDMLLTPGSIIADWGVAERALRFNLTDADVERLFAAAASEDWEIMHRASDVLVNLAHSRPGLRQQLESLAVGDQQRKWLVEDIEKELGPGVVPDEAEIAALVETVSQGGIAERRRAAQALGRVERFNPVIAQALRERLTDDSDDNVRANAAIALPLTLAEDVESLTIMLNQLASDKSPKVRIAIAQALGAVAGDHSNVRDALHGAMRDDSEVHVRTSAAAALAVSAVYRDEAKQTLYHIATTKQPWSVLGNAEDKAFKLLYALVVGDDENEADEPPT